MSVAEEASATTTTTTTRHHQRTPSGQSRKAKASGTKSLRPLTTRRDSTKTTQLKHSTTKPHSSNSNNSNSTAHVNAEEEDDDDMAPTFLQYCATCEKQITTPTFSGLYCSQACKSRDSSETNGYPLFRNDFHIPSSSRRSHSNLVSLGHDVMPQRSPTQPSALFPRHRSIPSSGSASSSTASSYTSDADMKRHSSSGSLSSLSGSPTAAYSHTSDRNGSEASLYLQQFHPSGYSGSPRRSSTANGVPSLSHTPSSHRTSSASSSSSISSPSSRPAIRTHTSFSHKGIDLVTPVTAEEQAEFDSSTMGSVASDDTIRPEGPNIFSKSIPIRTSAQHFMVYEKQQTIPKSLGGSSLGQLLETTK